MPLIIQIEEASIKSLPKIGIMICIFIIFQLFLRKKIKNTFFHKFASLLFCIYIIWTLTITKFPAINKITYHPDINFIPFYDIFSDFLQYIENILLFIPIGFLYVLLWKKNQKFIKVFLFSFCFSLFIEVFQIFYLGISDINDLLTNSIGSMLGYIFFLVINKLIPKFVRYSRTPVIYKFLNIEDWIYIFSSVIVYFVIPS